jgi:hypothetical protein
MHNPECPTCHIGYFTPGIIALSPPSPVLQYIVTYLAATKPTERKPLWEVGFSQPSTLGISLRLVKQVFALLIRAAEGHDVDLPDPHPILPYLGLYTLVTLKTEGLHPLHLRLTPCLPTLSTLENNIFVPAPPGTLPTAPNVSRIFDVLQTPEPSLDDTFGGIPISPLHPEYGQKRYWRLPIRPERVLAALWGRALNISPSVCEEIHHVQVINALLCLGTGFLETIMASGSGPSGFGGQREREEHGSDDGKERRSQNTMAVGKFFAGGGKSSDAGNNISDAPLNDEIGESSIRGPDDLLTNASFNRL